MMPSVEATNVRSATDHDFVKDTTSRVRHFIKLVNTADTSITQNKGTTKHVINYKECEYAGTYLPF